MKYTITHTCGHTEEHQIYGTNAHGERDRKIAWLETTLCPECYRKEQAEKAAAEASESGLTETEMKYSEYKNNYADCKTKPGSYNKESKTIIVFVQEAK